MFGRPRCREWTPLASQQLRLRSLIQIVGYNIRPPERCTAHCSFYLTLHHTTMSAPFYTTERVTSPHPKWKEIDSEMIQRMPSSNVVVRIWCHVSSSPNKENVQEKTSDVIIQTWGVYFSGLRYLGANLARNFTCDCFKANTLVFQMQGGYFCSYKSLKLDVIQPENEIEHSSLSSDSSNKTSSNKSTVEKKITRLKESIAVPGKLSKNDIEFSKSHDIEYSKSHSPIERGFKQSFPSVRASSSSNINKGKGETNQIYEHLPMPNSKLAYSSSLVDSISNPSQENITASKIDLSETAENYDLRSDSDLLPKYRYLALNFLKSEIRPSYTVAKLQKLHLLQYSIKKRKEAVFEVKERIYKKSALTGDNEKAKKIKPERNLFELETDLEASKASLQDLEANNVKVETKSSGPRLTLKLNDLLSLKTKPSPLQRAEHVRLTKQLEILRFKRIVLADERDRKLVNIRTLKEMYSKLFEENQDVGSELMRSYHALCRRHASLAATQTSSRALAELCARAHRELGRTRANLLAHCEDVFPIRQLADHTWTICNIPLPTSADTTYSPLPVHEPIAAAYTARALTLAAAFLDLRTRYAISFTPLAPVIEDAVRDLPDPNIPLYPRGGDTTLYRYGMFLLNKCIVQLLYSCNVGQSALDLRTTLPNLRALLHHTPHSSDSARLFGTYKGSEQVHSRAQSLRSLVASDEGRHGRQFNRFKEVVDGHPPQAVIAQQTHRYTKSVGSSPFDPKATAAPTIGSEPNIYNTKNVETENTLKQHNSESELDKIRENASKTHEIASNIHENASKIRDTASKVHETNVIFTIGDDTKELNIENERIVRLSVHNDIDISCQANIDSGFKEICSEIENYCSKSNDIECAVDICECKDIGSSEVSLSTTGAIDDTSIDIVKYLEINNDQNVISNVDNHIIVKEDNNIISNFTNANICEEIADVTFDREAGKNNSCLHTN